MKLLYAARMCRFDLLKAVCSLAQKVTRWDGECDRRLHRLMAYVKSSVDKRLVGYVGDGPEGWTPHLFTDADLAGCSESQRSTTGVFHCIRGPRTRFPIAAVSKRQGCVSHSTPEAELVALDHGLRSVALPAMEIWSIVMPAPQLVCHEDNDVAIRACRTGKNPTMRYLGRTHGISVAWLHERYVAKDYQLVYEPSHSMAADVFTKSFSNPEAWLSACWNVCTCDTGDAEDYYARGGISMKK